MAQDWNSLIKYIKRKIGVPFNYLEFSDDDIRDTIVEDVLPAFSQYEGKQLFVRLGPQNKVVGSEKNGPLTYKIPIPEGEQIVDVQEVYYNREMSLATMGVYSGVMYVMDPRDIVMTNEFLDMIKSLDVVPDFDWVPPDLISFSVPFADASVIIELKVVHTDLSQIPGDMYHEIFKDLCRAEILENLVAIRKKYKSISTPFGQLELNWEDMQQEAKDLRSTIQEKLDSLPPDHLISFVE